jgi:hypothetical protein
VPLPRDGSASPRAVLTLDVGHTICCCRVISASAARCRASESRILPLSGCHERDTMSCDDAQLLLQHRGPTYAHGLQTTTVIALRIPAPAFPHGYHASFCSLLFGSGGVGGVGENSGLGSVAVLPASRVPNSGFMENLGRLERGCCLSFAFWG